MEELKVGREDQREGRARRRQGASEDRDAHAVQRTLRFLVAVPGCLVVEVGEVHGVIDRQAHDHHDEDPRVCDRATEGSLDVEASSLDALLPVGMWAVDVGDEAMQRTDVELEAHQECRRQHPCDRGADGDYGQHGHQRVARDEDEYKV